MTPDGMDSQPSTLEEEDKDKDKDAEVSAAAEVGEEDREGDKGEETEETEEIEETDETEVDEEVDTDSEAPTPWPEGWYEGGMDLGLSQFAGKVMAAFPVQDSPCPGDNDAESSHSPVESHTTAQNTPADSSSPSGSGSGSSTAGYNQSSPPGQLPPSGHSHKRSRAGGDGEDDGAEDPRMPKRLQGGPPPEPTPKRGPFYACPCHKRCPHENPFCGMPHGSKREFGWDSVSRVK